MEFLVNGLHLHVRALHGNSRSHVLFVFQLRIALENLPAGKLIARTMIRSNGNFRTLFCRGDICRTIYHFNCMELCILRVQGNIAFRHLEGDPVLVDPIAQINAGRFPFFKLPAVLVRCPSSDCLPRKCLSSFRAIHLDDNSSTVGVDGVVLLVIRGQSHVLVRHGKGDPVLVDLIAQINAGRCPVFKDVTFFVRCPSFDRLPRTCLSSFRVIHLDDNSSIVGVDGVVHFRRNVHSIFVYVDGLTTRVDRRAVLSIRVDVLAAGIDDAACHAARAIVLDDDSGRARDRNIAPHDVVTIPLTRDCYRGGPFHRHIAVHGGASSRSNFHLAVTADLNIAEDGNIGLGRDLDVLCICDRQFAAYSCFT